MFWNIQSHLEQSNMYVVVSIGFDTTETEWGSRTCQLWQRWRASHKYVPGGTGAPSENWRSSSRYINPGHGCSETSWKPSLKQFGVCEKPSLEADYRTGLKCFEDRRTKETTQADFHPSLRYIPKGESEQPHWHPARGPGEFRCKDQWLPPFREPTPEVVGCGTAPGCVSWQCPKRGRRCTSSRKDEWQPQFRGDNGGDSPPRELASQGGFRTCLQRTPGALDEWQPPWKQGGDVQHEDQEQSPPQRLVNPKFATKNLRLTTKTGIYSCYAILFFCHELQWMVERTSFFILQIASLVFHDKEGSRRMVDWNWACCCCSSFWHKESTRIQYLQNIVRHGGT